MTATTQPYIDLGWHTVPLQGKLVRLDDGKKSIPLFGKNWRKEYSDTRNTTATSLGGVITGERSGIIAIDCDNEHTWQLFRQMDPDYSFVFVSEGKQGGTLIYSYDEELHQGFALADNVLALDFYSNNGFVYLPTEANQTKKTLHEPLPELKPAPATIKSLIHALTPKQAPVVSTADTTRYNLAPLLRLLPVDGFTPGLFRILTPYSFRNTPQYIKEGTLHPNNVPQGHGSEYLAKVSAILGADCSVDEELYTTTMHTINDMWDSPMDAARLDSTVIEPMLQGKASVDGKAIWQFDATWDANKLILTTKRQASLELGFDDHRNIYYAVDVANEILLAFATDNELHNYISSAAVNPMKKPEMRSALPVIDVVSEPHRPFGFSANKLNTFRQTPELRILSDPDSYSHMYKTPTTTLKFLSSLVPDDTMREFILSFLKRKLTTFDYSPVVLYFVGAHGSGKDTFVQILEKIMGHMARPTTREFLEVYNGWLMHAHFVQLDEFGNQLTTARDKEEALGRLKAYTGKQNVQIRRMRTDSFTHKHCATFIMTSNKNPLGIEDGDRRAAIIDTPNVLMEQPWVTDMAEVYKQIMNETCDFAYYLATKVPDGEYMKPPENMNKNVLIADSMYAANRIAFALKHEMTEYLNNLCDEYGVPHLNGTLDSATELYDIMTDFRGETRSLNKSLRLAGVRLK